MILTLIPASVFSEVTYLINATFDSSTALVTSEPATAAQLRRNVTPASPPVTPTSNPLNIENGTLHFNKTVVTTGEISATRSFMGSTVSNALDIITSGKVAIEYDIKLNITAEASGQYNNGISVCFYTGIDGSTGYQNYNAIQFNYNAIRFYNASGTRVVLINNPHTSGGNPVTPQYHVKQVYNLDDGTAEVIIDDVPYLSGTLTLHPNFKLYGIKNMKINMGTGSLGEAWIDNFQIYNMEDGPVTLNKTALLSAISSAQATHNAAVEGTEAGQYEAGARSALQSAINTAQNTYDTATLQSQITSAVSVLSAAVTAFESKKVQSADGSTDLIPLNTFEDIGGLTINYPNPNNYKTENFIEVSGGKLHYKKSVEYPDPDPKKYPEMSVTQKFTPVLSGKVALEADITVEFPNEANLSNNAYVNGIGLGIYENKTSGMQYSVGSLTSHGLVYRDAPGVRNMVHSQSIPDYSFKYKQEIDLDAKTVNFYIDGVKKGSDYSIKDELNKSGVSSIKFNMSAAALGEVWIDNLRVYIPAAEAADKTVLMSAISSAQAKHDSAVEGTEIGQYAVGSKATFQTAINAAKAVNDNASATQAQVDNAKSTLETAVATFESSKIKGADGSVDLIPLNEFYTMGGLTAGYPSPNDLKAQNYVEVKDGKLHFVKSAEYPDPDPKKYPEMSVTQKFTPVLNGKVALEADITAEFPNEANLSNNAYVNGIGLGIYENKTSGMKYAVGSITSHGLVYRDKEDVRNMVYPQSTPNYSFKYKQEIDLDEGIVKFYIDNVLIGTDYSTKAELTSSGVNSIKFNMSAAALGEVWIDNLRVYIPGAEPLYKDELLSLISSSQAMYNTAVEGTAIGEYEVNSKSVLQTAINTAQSVCDTATKQNQLDSAKSALESAIAAFEVKRVQAANKTALLSAITNAKLKLSGAVAGTDSGQYPQKAIDDLNATVLSAQAVYDNAHAGQAAVNAAQSALNLEIDIFDSLKILSDEFLEEFIGSSLPAGFKKGGSGTVEVVKGMDGANGNVLRLAQEPGQTGTNLEYIFPELYTGVVLVEYRIRANIPTPPPPANPNDPTISYASEIMFKNTDNKNFASMKVEHSGARMMERIGGGNRFDIVAPNYRANEWYYHRVLIDFDNGVASVRSNDYPIQNPGKIDPAISSNFHIYRMFINAPTQGEIFLDDIRVTNIVKPTVKRLTLEDGTPVINGEVPSGTRTVLVHFNGGLTEDTVNKESIPVKNNGANVNYYGAYDRIFNTYLIKLPDSITENDNYTISFLSLSGEFEYVNYSEPNRSFKMKPSDYIINQISYDKASVAAIDGVSLKATANVTNASNSVSSMTLFVVCYENGILKGIKTEEFSVAAGETKNIEAIYGNITSKQGLIFNAFVTTGSVNSLMPVSSGKELR